MTTGDGVELEWRIWICPWWVIEIDEALRYSPTARWAHGAKREGEK